MLVYPVTDDSALIKALLFFNSVSGLDLCVFQSLSFPGNIFYIQIIVLSN